MIRSLRCYATLLAATGAACGAVEVPPPGQYWSRIPIQCRLTVDVAEVADDLASPSSAPLLIGNRTGGPDVSNPGRVDDFSGDLDDVRVRSRALEADEVSIVHNEALR